VSHSAIGPPATVTPSQTEPYTPNKLRT